MSCPGLHCAGCGAAVPVVPLIAVFGLAWVAEHIIEVIAVSAACGVLAVAAAVALARWNDRRAARVWAARPAQLRAAPVTALPRAAASAIEQHTHYHQHYHAAPESPARIVIPGTAGDITGGGD